jgi:uncharacterized membrane protein YhfC
MDAGLLSTIVIVVVVVVLAPILLGVWFARRWRVPWLVFFYGALVWAISQYFTRIPALQFLGPTAANLIDQSAWYKYGWFLFLALTAGLFEEGGRYLGYRFFWKKLDKTWPQALMYGAGHGWSEAVLLVGLPLAAQLVSCLYAFQTDPTTLAPDQALLVNQAREACTLTFWWVPLIAMLERLMALAVHISLSVLVLQVFTRGKGYWWWLAVGYHALTNLVAILVGDALTGVLSQEVAILLTEATILPFALFSLWLIWRLRPPAAELSTYTQSGSNA